MIHDRDYQVWIAVEQRLDGLTGRWGPDPYINVVLNKPGDGGERISFNISTDMAKLLARGLTKAVKRSAAP